MSLYMKDGKDNTILFGVRNISLGSLQIFCMSDGIIHFDGGAMFHIIPKTLWQRNITSDGQNRIPIALNSLYLEVAGKKILIDAGAGNKYSSKLQSIFKRSTRLILLETLKHYGIDRNAIDIVLLSHLHRDHTGSLTYYNTNCIENTYQNIELSFPNAQHIVSNTEWDFAHAGNELSRVSYNKDDFTPVHQAGLFYFFEGEKQHINEHIIMQKTGGHSLGHSMIIIEDKTETLLFPSDIIPTRHHIPLNWTCSYDYHSYAVVDQKRSILQMAVEKDAIVCLVHEIEHPIGKVRIKHNKYCWEPVEEVFI